MVVVDPRPFFEWQMRRIEVVSVLRKKHRLVGSDAFDNSSSKTRLPRPSPPRNTNKNRHHLNAIT